LCGDVALPAYVAGPPGEESVSAGELAALKAEQARMGAELEELRTLVQRMARELGME
jgi:hypothetical protein